MFVIVDGNPRLLPQGLLILLMICTQQRFAIGVTPSVA
jgi:hypothetical protein